MPRCNCCGKPRVTMSVSHQVPTMYARWVMKVEETVCRVCQRWAAKMGVRA